MIDLVHYHDDHDLPLIHILLKLPSDILNIASKILILYTIISK